MLRVFCPIALSIAHRATRDQAPAGHSHLITGSHSLSSRCTEYVHRAPLSCPAPFHFGAFVIAAPLPRKLFYWSVCTAGSFSPFQSLPSGHVLWEVCFWHPHPQTPFPSINLCNGSLFILFITRITVRLLICCCQYFRVEEISCLPSFCRRRRGMPGSPVLHSQRREMPDQ